MGLLTTSISSRPSGPWTSRPSRRRRWIIRGDADADVELVHGRYAADRIHGAELLVLETGTHLALYTHPGSDSAQARAVEMLLRR